MSALSSSTDDTSSKSSSHESSETTQQSDSGTGLTSVPSLDPAADPAKSSKNEGTDEVLGSVKGEEDEEKKPSDTANSLSSDKEGEKDQPAVTRPHLEEVEDTYDMRYLVKDEIDDRYYNLDTTANLIAARKKAPVRILQYQHYIGMMEDRVRYLEKELEELKIGQTSRLALDNPTISGEHAAGETLDLPKFPEDTKIDDIPSLASKEPGVKCECKPLTFDEFQRGKPVTSHIITTLADDQEPHHLKTAPNGKILPISKHSQSSGRLSRVCIRSKPILDFFEKHLPKDTAPTMSKCIIMRPFKPICMLEEKIRSHLLSLNAEIERRPEDEVAQDAAPKPAETEPFSPISAAGLDSLKTNEDADINLQEESLEELTSARDHFQTLVQLMDGKLKPDLDQHKSYRQPDTKCPEQIYFEDLWHLFTPGRIAYADHPNGQAYLILNIRGGRRLYDRPYADRPAYDYGREKPIPTAFKPETYSNFCMDCVFIDYDGTDLDFVPHVLEVPYFKGERDINSLPVVPIEVASKKDETSCRDYLRERGKKFVELTRDVYAHRDYTGVTLPNTDNPTSRANSREQIDSQVIIDFEHAYLQGGRKPNFAFPIFPDPDENELPDSINTGICTLCSPSSGCTFGRLYCYDDRELDKASRQELLASDKVARLEGDMTELQLIILPSYVYGYVLRNLDWHKLDVSLLTPPKKNTNFQDLILPPQNRDLVESLVKSRRNHPKTRSDRADVVRGKGQGVIVLLHGVPGTGKSSTAECVAESLGCPLFTLTCGNIGTKPAEVQENLQNMFYMAHKWNCVMLLDEADVFLQERDETDMERNAVVSVFLRALEYYSGILFLTTNKVGKFDEAFVSRIHQAIEYPALDRPTTCSIWQVNLRKLKEKRGDVVFNESDLLNYAGIAWDTQMSRRRVTWNGRQIRNAFQTAVALAEHSSLLEPRDKESGKIELKREHFMKVGEVSDRFDEYLRKTRNNRDWLDVAQAHQDRYDSRKDDMVRQNRSQGQHGPPMQNYGYGSPDQGGRPDAYNNMQNLGGGHAGYGQAGAQNYYQQGQFPGQGMQIPLQMTFMEQTQQQLSAQNMQNQNMQNQNMMGQQGGTPAQNQQQPGAFVNNHAPMMNAGMQGQQQQTGLPQTPQFSAYGPGQMASMNAEMQTPSRTTPGMPAGMIY